MIREPKDQLYAGIHNSVVAIDARDGTEVWRTKLGGMSLVNVFWDGEGLYASAKGEVSRLDPRDGQVLWNSPLKGLGTGSVMLASARRPSDSSQQLVPAELQRRKQQAAASGAG